MKIILGGQQNGWMNHTEFFPKMEVWSFLGGHNFKMQKAVI